MEVLDIVSECLVYRHVHYAYEVLLYVDERDVVLSEELSNASSVGGLVTRDVVSVENGRETGNVEGCGGEFA